MQVQQLSAQVAEQARMIQQLQTQALAPHLLHSGARPAQQSGPAASRRAASRRAAHQHRADIALVLRERGTVC